MPDPIRETTAADWQPFDHQNPPEGLCWLEVERPETWCDAGDDGRTVGGYTGKTERLVVLADVFRDEEEGADFECVHGGEFGEVRSDDAVRRFMRLVPPSLAIQEAATDA